MIVRVLFEVRESLNATKKSLKVLFSIWENILMHSKLSSWKTCNDTEHLSSSESGGLGHLDSVVEAKRKNPVFFPKRDENFLEVIFPMQNISGVINSFMVKVWWKSLEFRDHHVNTCLVWHQSYAWTLIGQPSPVIRY